MSYRTEVIEELQARTVTPEALHKFCAANGISRTTLAQILKVTTGTVSNWYSGKSEPPGYLGLALNELQRRILDLHKQAGF